VITRENKLVPTSPSTNFCIIDECLSECSHITIRVCVAAVRSLPLLNTAWMSADTELPIFTNRDSTQISSGNTHLEQILQREQTRFPTAITLKITGAVIDFGWFPLHWA
jgi:hypothetical protein